MTKSQASLFDYHDMGSVRKKYGRTFHGGVSSKGHRKEQRPLARRKWTHLVLKSSRAKGAWSFLTPKNKIFIERLLKENAKKWGIQISDFANVGNHLHIKCRFNDAKNFQNFLRSITALIARFITKAKKGHKLSAPFWQGLAFTRVLKTSFEELQLRAYFKANHIEAAKGEKHREDYLKNFNRWLYRLKQSSVAILE